MNFKKGDIVQHYRHLTEVEAADWDGENPNEGLPLDIMATVSASLPETGCIKIEGISTWLDARGFCKVPKTGL
jgi:hypothetical protein